MTATGSCPAGSTLVRALSCEAATHASAAMTGAATTYFPGDVVSIDPGEGKLPCLPALLCRPDGAPTLVFSDEPESPTHSGILYADDLDAGAYRIYVYHTNGGSTARKFSVVALNQGDMDVTVTWGHRGIAGPSNEYVGTARAAAATWLRSRSSGDQLTVPAGQRIVLDQNLDDLTVEPGELVVAQLDFVANGPLELSVVTVEPGTDAAAATATLGLLPNDGRHDRGTFTGSADLILAPPDGGWALDGLRHIRLGSGDAAGEPLVTGRDAVDRITAHLRGSYGVQYRIVPGGSHVAFGVSPRGGAWGGAVNPDASVGTSGVSLPSGASFDSDPSTMIVLGQFDASTLGELDLFSAGGSNLPVDLISIPF